MNRISVALEFRAALLAMLMPSFRKKLREADQEALIGFLRSLK
jgi:hypothetical protein